MPFFENIYFGIVENPIILSPLTNDIETAATPTPPPLTRFVVTHTGEQVIAVGAQPVVAET